MVKFRGCSVSLRWYGSIVTLPERHTTPLDYYLPMTTCPVPDTMPGRGFSLVAYFWIFEWSISANTTFEIGNTLRVVRCQCSLCDTSTLSQLRHWRVALSAQSDCS